VVVVSYPVPGRGALAWFLDLAPIGPKLASEFGSGVHQLEFLVTTGDGKTVVSRSIDPAYWIGRNVSGFVSGSASASQPDVNGTQRIYGRSTVDPAGWRVYVGADEAAACRLPTSCRTVAWPSSWAAWASCWWSHLSSTGALLSPCDS